MKIIKCPECKSLKVILSNKDCQGVWGHCQKCGYEWQIDEDQRIRLSSEDIQEKE